MQRLMTVMHNQHKNMPACINQRLPLVNMGATPPELLYFQIILLIKLCFHFSDLLVHIQ